MMQRLVCLVLLVGPPALRTENVKASLNPAGPQNQMFPLRLIEENVKIGNCVDPEWKFLALGSYMIGLNHKDS